MHLVTKRVAGVNVEIRCTHLEQAMVFQEVFDGDDSSVMPVTFKVTICSVPHLLPGPLGNPPRGSRRFSLAQEQEYVFDPGTNCYDIRVGDGVAGVIDLDGGTGSFDVVAGLQPRTVLHVTLLDPLSLFLPRYDALVLHAAAVHTPAGAVLLIGPSGVGKSTLSFLLSHGKVNTTVRHLTDDTLILVFREHGAIIYPVRSGFGLDESILSSYGVTFAEADILQRSRGKTYIKRLPHCDIGPAPAARLVFLEHSNTNNGRTDLIPQSRADTLKRLLDSQTTIANPYMINRLHLHRRLASILPAALCQYSVYCDVDILRRAVLGQGM